MSDYYPKISEQMAGSATLAPRTPTTRERLVEQRKALEQRLQDINDALKALDNFPDFEKIHNLLTKVL